MTKEWKSTEMIPEEYQLNLSDFALFLSVMKNKEAYECTLSIILEEDNLKLKEVKVEQVVLNRKGKRAIRLDAWALDYQNRQINTEMQNTTEGDDVRKRSRYYQGLLDSPILKSGKRTRYKQLPSTVIIFITQEDIFERDLARYTFTEQCEEIAGLHLEDGTTKIFLNMSSKNGTPELVSLLQYMKETSLDNPEIQVKDKRIVRLDEIVQEVKQSEEWEAVKMNILEIGIEHGRAEGKAEGIAEGREEGKAEGKMEGEARKLIEIVCKKLKKGKDSLCIAEELEEEIEKIQSICEVAELYAPDYDNDKIYHKFISKNADFSRKIPQL